MPIKPEHFQPENNVNPLKPYARFNLFELNDAREISCPLRTELEVEAKPEVIRIRGKSYQVLRVNCPNFNGGGFCTEQKTTCTANSIRDQVVSKGRKHTADVVTCIRRYGDPLFGERKLRRKRQEKDVDCFFTKKAIE